LTLLEDLKEPRYITPADKCFKVLKQDFRFGPRELSGLKIFFTRPAATARDQTNRPSIGNCVACHTPPNFTDFIFHNTGASQAEYDGLHGGGAFANLFIPELPERDTNYDAWLPPTANHSRARGIFLEIPSREMPGRADLGLWNVFANPDQPAVQAALLSLFTSGRQPQPPEVLLPRTIALFKTPTLRGLAHSQPYLHTGEKDSLEDVIRFYIKSSALARAGKLRNGAPELADIRLRDDDVDLVASFLRALNEDYE
jgi:cytochrome c peroxidase